MKTPMDARDFARFLVALEAALDPASARDKTPVHRVYQKLRLNLSGIAGSAAFRAFALRALAQARSHSPGLSTVRIATSGALEGLEPSLLEPQLDGSADPAAGKPAGDDPPGAEGISLIASLLTLLLVFLGEALMLSLLRDTWPGADFEDRISLNWRKQ